MTKSHLDDVVLKAQSKDSRDARFEDDLEKGLVIERTEGEYNLASDLYNEWIDYMLKEYEIGESELRKTVNAYKLALATPDIRLRGRR